MLNDEKILNLKKGYKDVEIPEQLTQIVQDTINRAETELLEENIKKEKAQRGKKMKKQIGSIAAAIVIVIGAFGIGVNTNEAFADSVSQIPVLSSLAKVFTIEQVHEETDSYVADMKIPGIEGLKDEKLQKRINELVHNQVTAAVDETKVTMQDYKKAFLETGGKEEDFMQQEISVDYDVKCLSDKVLSFSVYKTETLASAYFDMFYYNYDLTTSQPLTLRDMLGSDYIEIANKQIKEQIAERAKNPDNMYWDGSDGIEGFTSISDSQQFYVNKAGNPVIVFNKYEIAPGYMGIQEFEITK
ncbi:DUF3298 and DUF4163 domain-containing protein [Aminipila sp.]|uniref:DUF3298 and DUF4163 domain-containing protein n=1 Tax=Aminipila sp. TaxID=2060095 RepID=UPI0028A10D42|nr:DUF3298 domain-containing protein [Aminipila sp.]